MIDFIVRGWLENSFEINSKTVVCHGSYDLDLQDYMNEHDCENGVDIFIQKRGFIGEFEKGEINLIIKYFFTYIEQSWLFLMSRTWNENF